MHLPCASLPIAWWCACLPSAYDQTFEFYHVTSTICLRHALELWYHTLGLSVGWHVVTLEESLHKRRFPRWFGFFSARWAEECSIALCFLRESLMLCPSERPADGLFNCSGRWQRPLLAKADLDTVPAYHSCCCMWNLLKIGWQSLSAVRQILSGDSSLCSNWHDPPHQPKLTL